MRDSALLVYVPGTFSGGLVGMEVVVLLGDMDCIEQHLMLPARQSPWWGGFGILQTIQKGLPQVLGHPSGSTLPILELGHQALSNQCEKRSS